MIVNGSNLFVAPVFGSQWPSEGPKALPVPMDFSQAGSYSLDFGNEQDKGRLSMVQACFIDASQVDAPVTIQPQGSNQTLTVKGRTQGYYALLASNPFSVLVSCANGAGIVLVQFLNFPVASAQWSTQ